MASRRRLFRYGILCAAVVFVATLAMSLAYARSLPSEYTGSGVVQFSPKATKNGGVVGAETVSSSASGYVAYMGAPGTLQAVARAIGTQPATLKDGLKITLVPATTTVAVDYTARTPSDAAEGSNAMMSTVVTRAKGDPLVSASLMAQAAVPLNPSGPQRIVIAAAGFALAALLAVAVFAVFVVIARRRGVVAAAPTPEAEAPRRDRDRAPRGVTPTSVGPSTGDHYA